MESKKVLRLLVQQFLCLPLFFSSFFLLLFCSNSIVFELFATSLFYARQEKNRKRTSKILQANDFSQPFIYNSFISPNWITLIMRKNIKQKIYIFCWFFFLHFALFVWFYVNLFFFSNFFYLFHFKRILYSMLFTYIVFNASSKRIHITAFWRVSTANIPGHGFVILDEIKLYFLWFFNAPFNP